MSHFWIYVSVLFIIVGVALASIPEHPGETGPELHIELTAPPRAHVGQHPNELTLWALECADQGGNPRIVVDLDNDVVTETVCEEFP